MRAFTIILSLSLILASLLFSCNKDSETEKEPETMHFSGLTATDIQGQLMGYFGEDGFDAEDWKYDSVWTAKELETVSFDDSITLEGTYMDFDGEIPYCRRNTCVVAYPNPTSQVIAFYFRFSGIAKVKGCIVDSTLKPLATFSAKDSIVQFHFILGQYPGYENKFEPGILYRLYYSCSTKDSLNFHKGHGDIMWCDEPYPISECLKFIP